MSLFHILHINGLIQCMGFILLLASFTQHFFKINPYYMQASLVAQLVKNLPVVRETWVRPLGWEDPLEKGKATHSSILAWRIPVHGVTKSQTRLSNFYFHITVQISRSFFFMLNEHNKFCRSICPLMDMYVILTA